MDARNVLQFLSCLGFNILRMLFFLPISLSFSFFLLCMWEGKGKGQEVMFRRLTWAGTWAVSLGGVLAQ
jgi:hypothetical protein